jgi:hypothetical protein
VSAGRREREQPSPTLGVVVSPSAEQTRRQWRLAHHTKQDELPDTYSTISSTSRLDLLSARDATKAIQVGFEVVWRSSSPVLSLYMNDQATKRKETDPREI